ncbi:MAG TPA: peptidoglycan DD-metalloendopeptidase family protein [Pseudolabrys sp.]|jgi:murein DD-endopeptidase MepM/ murein hydrolase activator NlpD
MSRIYVPSRSCVWLRVAVPALLGIAVAGCADSARFDSSPYASNRNAPPQETTGSIPSRPASGTHVVSQPLPAPSRPATVAANGGVASGAQGLGAYRPGTSDVTGSVATQRAPAPAPTGHWTWDGGAPVTVASGETFESIGRKYGVPASAIMETNGFREGATLRPGQRVVIPRYISASASHAPASPSPRTAENVHIVEPGESLIGIAHKHGVSLKALAQANNIQPYAKISIGDSLTIPGGRPVAARQTPAPQVAQPRTVPATKVASAPVQTARVATPEQQPPETVTKTAEAAGSIPSFRWPVKGRIIAGFGPRPNGAPNDGINLAVPEGTPIKAADDGIVAYAGSELKGYGNLVLIRHANGFVSAYANASQLLVKRGDTIKRGQVIANAGQTGNVTSPQLHFEIRKGSTPVDPTKYLGGA